MIYRVRAFATNLRFGSLAVVEGHLSLTAALGSKADTQPGRMSDLTNTERSEAPALRKSNDSQRPGADAQTRLQARLSACVDPIGFSASRRLVFV